MEEISELQDDLPINVLSELISSVSQHNLNLLEANNFTKAVKAKRAFD